MLDEKLWNILVLGTVLAKLDPAKQVTLCSGLYISCREIKVPTLKCTLVSRITLRPVRIGDKSAQESTASQVQYL